MRRGRAIAAFVVGYGDADQLPNLSDLEAQFLLDLAEVGRPLRAHLLPEVIDAAA